MEAIQTQAKFKSVVRSERAIVFISFAWSHQALLSEQVVKEWERGWNIWHPKLSVDIYKLEPDEYPITWEWLKSTKVTWEWLKSTKERGGYGSLAWIKNSVIVDSESYVIGAGLRDIVRRTEQAFGEG